ncbi:MAG: hypothetical protein AB1631_06575 [Acidobacteriota bacterium]
MRRNRFPPATLARGAVFKNRSQPSELVLLIGRLRPVKLKRCAKGGSSSEPEEKIKYLFALPP